MFKTNENKSVLIVEDDEIIAELIKEIIIEQGYIPYYKKNGHEAISWLRENLPDLMILDYALPDMNAAILISLLSHENEIVPPFIISTGMGDEFIAVDMMKRGARDYLVKNSQFLSNLPLVINRIIRELDTENRLFKTQDQLHENQERLRTVIDNVPDLICFKDIEGNLLEANHYFEKIFRLKDKPYLNLKYNDLALLAPEFKDYFLKQNESDILAWESKKPIQLRETIKISDRKEITLDTIKIPMYNHNGSKKALIIVGRDITDILKNLEEKKDIEKKALKAQKLESLGILAGGIAHDFNNLLTVILGHTDLALHFTNQNTNIYGSLKEIENSAKRAAELCQQMLAYSGKGKFFVQIININYIIKNINSILASSIDKKIKLEIQLDNQLPLIEGDSNQIQQLIINLLTNASEAIGNNNGNICLKTGIKQCDKPFIDNCLFTSDNSPGDYVFISISDDGSGITPELYDKIFEPFYTTKFAGRGLGLPAVQGIVKSHKGMILLNSQLEHHTEITAFFPVYKQINTLNQNNSDSELIHFNKNNEILLIDDELAILKTAKEIMEFLGLKVNAFCDTSQAIQFYKENSGNISFSIIDMSMPQLNGLELFQQIKSVNPNALAIICSGFNESITISNSDDKNHIDFLQKPYNMKNLSAKLSVFCHKHNIIIN